MFEICLSYSNCVPAESAAVLALQEVQMISEPQSILVNSIVTSMTMWNASVCVGCVKTLTVVFRPYL